MALFHDKKKKPKEMTKGQKRRRLALRIVLILALLFCISLWVLGLLGGPHEALKKGAEDYLSEATGMTTHIGEFEGLYFFPTVRFDGGNISFRDEKTVPAATIGHIDFSASFWDIFFSRTKLRSLNINDVNIRADVISSEPVKVLYARLSSETPHDKAGLMIEGSYGSESFDLFYETAYDGTAYSIPDDAARLLSSLGSYELDGRAGLNTTGGGVRLKIESFGTTENSINGHTVLMRDRTGWHLDFGLRNGKTDFTAKFVRDDGKITGTVTSDVLYAEDFGGAGSMADVIEGFVGVIDPPKAGDEEGEIRLPRDLDVSLQVNIKKIMFRGKDSGFLSFPVTIRDGVLKVGDIKGALNGGTAGGLIALDTRQPDGAVLDLHLSIDDMKYGVENLDGRARFEATLKGQGKTETALKSSLKGDIALIGGKGKLESRALRIWGGGILNSMVPDLDPESKTVMNCFIADFIVEDGIAKASPFFIDTASLTLVGDGEINIPNNEIDFTIKPKTKEVALLDVAFPVNISGDLGDPSIGPDALGVGSKIGGLLLGTVNPAFFALNLAKLGVTDEHPCSSYSSEDMKAVVDAKPAVPESAEEPIAEEEASASEEKQQEEIFDNGNNASTYDFDVNE